LCSNFWPAASKIEEMPQQIDKGAKRRNVLARLPAGQDQSTHCVLTQPLAGWFHAFIHRFHSRRNASLKCIVFKAGKA
jgi:hypothetical protein